MQKEQNVIKVLLIFFVLVLFHKETVYSQKRIIGVYSSLAPLQEHYNYYNFKSSGTFEYHAGASLGDSEFGIGHYFIRNDSLILNYDLTKLEAESYFKAKKYYNYKDSIEIKINVYNFNKKPIYNLGIYTFPIYKSTESDKHGKAILKFKKQKTKNKIALYLDGEFLARQIIYLDYDANYNIDAYMSKSSIAGFGHPKAYKNQLVKYKILKLSKEEIKLKTKKGFLLLKSNNK